MMQLIRSGEYKRRKTEDKEREKKRQKAENVHRNSMRP